MKVLLIDIDSKIPNLALKKIEKYYLDKGDKIIWNMPIMRDICDKVYVSCVFDWNRKQAEQWEGLAEIGGSGWDLITKLPPEIEMVKPRINWGFTTRGCIRNCEFCIVPQKEGNIRIEGDIYDIWDRKSKKIIIMDNNILAMPKHFKKICSQIYKEKLKVDFNQGLDLRLLNDELIKELKTISHEEYKFSWDLDDDSFVEKLKWLYNHLKRCTIFVLCGFLPFEKILWKLNIIRDIGHNGYVMRYRNVYKEKKYILLARWVNQHHIFQTHAYEEFIEKDSKYYHPNDYLEKPRHFTNRNKCNCQE